MTAEDRSEDHWAPFKFFLGTWEGTGKGKPGEGRLEREYRLVLGRKFVEIRNRSTYEPQESNPEGEVHEDVGYVSYDAGRETFVLREFHVEGFVNQYVLDSIQDDGKTFVFVTENIENIPPGWRARTTYRILNEDEFTETFDLAGPEKDFDCYIENHLRRRR